MIYAEGITNPGRLSTDEDAIVQFSCRRVVKGYKPFFLPQVFCFGAANVNSKLQSSTVR